MSVQLRVRPSRHAHALPVLAGDPHARGLLVLGIEEHDVGDVDRAFLLDHAAYLLGPLGAPNLLRALMALHDVETLDEDALLARLDAEHAARLAAVLAADHDDLVV